MRERVRVERRSESGARVRVWQEKERWLERVGQQRGMREIETKIESFFLGKTVM